MGASPRTIPKSSAPEYDIWISMRRRCNSPRDKSFHNYGGRGIKVCERWDRSFAAFWEDMGPRPTAKHSLDRIDNDGNYEPGNCRWATQLEQHRNTRKSLWVTYRGETRLLLEWSQILDKDHFALYHRIRRGWTAERAFETPTARRWTPRKKWTGPKQAGLKG